jgi:hypothetical protein
LWHLKLDLHVEGGVIVLLLHELFWVSVCC